MKNVTLSAEENLIEEARKIARSRNSTLNSEFRAWLADYTGRGERLQKYDELKKELENFHIDRKYTRDEMNAR
jgi:hypothetical protein